MKKIIKILIIIVSCFVGLFLLFLLISSITEYNPEPSTDLQKISSGTRVDSVELTPLTLLTWNIGYAGLDANTDFILDGGTKSIGTSREVVDENMTGILDMLSRTPTDFYFLQEVDKPSHRSYSLNEVNMIIDSFPLYSAWFAKNFHVLFVPFPLLSPIGPVQSGMISLSKYNALSSIRISLPGQYGWPVKLFHLKRCMNVLKMESPVKGKDLYLINLHLSAYDQGGVLRKQQLGFIKEYLLTLYSNNHYIIAGGDWNALFPGIEKDTFGVYLTEEKDLYWVQQIPEDWIPEGWQWGFDPTIPSCRSLDTPYDKGKNFLTVIDGFLLSPNLKILEVKGFDLGFRFSDHQPVLIRVEMIE